MLINKNFNLKYFSQHPFHTVNASPWPIMTAVALFCLSINFLSFFHYYKSGSTHFIISLMVVCFYLFRWLSDIIVEATLEVHHTSKFQKVIRFGMCLLIVSEVMFFFSFFWGFFHCVLSPSIGIGCIWPPTAVSTISAWGSPLWNTISVLFYMTSGKLNKTVFFLFLLLIVLINVFITLIFFKDEKFTKKLQNFSLLTFVVMVLLFLIILVVFDNINEFSNFLNSLYEFKQFLICIYLVTINLYCPLYLGYVVLLKTFHWVSVKCEFFFHYNNAILTLAVALFVSRVVSIYFGTTPFIDDIVRGQTAYYVSNFLYWWFWPSSMLEPVPTEVVDVLVDEALPYVYGTLGLCVYLFAIGDCLWCLYSIWQTR